MVVNKFLNENGVEGVKSFRFSPQAGVDGQFHFGSTLFGRGTKKVIFYEKFYLSTVLKIRMIIILISYKQWLMDVKPVI